MKKRIISNYILICLAVIIGIAISVYVLLDKLTNSEGALESMDVLICVGTPFFCVIVVAGVIKACLGSITSVKEFYKVDINLEKEVTNVGKHYKENLIYLVKAFSFMALVSIICAIVLFVCGANNYISLPLGIVGGILLIILAIICFFGFLYYTKLNSLDEYEVGKIYLNKIQK